jgi:hypothetical protein
MSTLDRFKEYSAKFEEVFHSRNWTELESFMDEAVTYEIISEPPFNARFEGREAVINGLRKSVDQLDRRFDERTPDIVDGPRVRGDNLWFSWITTFSVANAPEFMLNGEEAITYKDRKIIAIEDRIPKAVIDRFQRYLSEHEDQLHPPQSSEPYVPSPPKTDEGAAPKKTTTAKAKTTAAKAKTTVAKAKTTAAKAKSTAAAKRTTTKSSTTKAKSTTAAKSKSTAAASTTKRTAAKSKSTAAAKRTAAKSTAAETKPRATAKPAAKTTAKPRAAKPKTATRSKSTTTAKKES